MKGGTSILPFTLITIKLAPFYIAYTLCIIPDSIFIGYGKTYYNAINSILVNFVYYGIWFVLYMTKAITFSMDAIILMFGFGMVFHEAISIVEERIFFKRNIITLVPKKDGN